MKMIHGLYLADAAAARVATLLSAHRNGCTVDFTTPLIGSEYRWDPDLGRSKCALSMYDHCKLDGLPMWLREEEAIQRAKHGAYSNIRGYDDPASDGRNLATLVSRYFSGHTAHLQAQAARHADKFVAGLFTASGDRLSPVSLEVAAESFERRTGLGWPVVTSDPAYLGHILELSRILLVNPIERQACLLFPALIGSRGQPAGPYLRAKARAVFQCSRVIGNLEKMFFMPLMKYLRDFPCFPAWSGQCSVNWAVTGMFEDCRGPFLSIDYSNFDASVSETVLNRVFAIVKNWFAVSSHDLFDLVRYHFLNCGIITPNSYLIGRNGGIPSGSVLTNVIGSLVNLWSMAYAANRCGVTISRCLIQGDDGVFAFRGEVSPQALSSVLYSDLGMVMSVDKNYFSPDEIRFLSMVHRRSYSVDGVNVGIRPLMRVLNGMMSYERFRINWSGYMDSLRWFQQLENAAEHPCFNAACEWLLAHDKFASRYSVDELIARAGGDKAVQSSIGSWDGTNTIDRLKRSRVAKTIRTLMFG